MNIKNKIKALATDYGDNLLFARKNNIIYGEEKIKELMEKTARAGYNTMVWRVNNINYTTYYSKEKEILPLPELKEIKKDPLELAVKYARQYNLNIYAYMTLFDESYPSKHEFFGLSKFVENNKNFCWKHRSFNDYLYGLLEFYYPEVREYFLRQVKELCSYGVDGIYFDVARSHCGIQKIYACPYPIPAFLNYGYNTELCKEAEKKLNFNPANGTIDFKNYNKLNVERDNEYQRFRGEYLTMFIKNASEYIRNENKKVMAAFYPDSEGYLSPKGYNVRIPLGHYHINWEKWIKERYVDTIVLIAEHRRFGYDDWAGYSKNIFEPYMEKYGINTLLWASVEERIDHALDNNQVKLPVKYGNEGFNDIFIKYMRKLLSSSASGILCYESAFVEKNEDTGYWQLIERSLSI